MKLHFSHSSFSLEDVINGKINQKKFTPSESYVFNFIKQWHSDKTAFDFNTSGSTGSPKKITLTKSQLSYSAHSTLHQLFGKKQLTNLLLCINPEFIGGTQVIIRSILANGDLYVTPASSQLSHFSDVPFDLASMVPIQVVNELKKPTPFKNMDTVLIGGSSLNQGVEDELTTLKTVFYHTYGMTETASHVALRKIGTEYFKPIGDVLFDMDKRECLRIKGSVTENQWIQTNDLVSINTHGIKILGRADWVINSGGMKIHPEEVEGKILDAFPKVKLAISSLPDPVLGERVILFTNVPLLERLKSKELLSKYELPKEEIIIDTFPETKSGKLDRQALRNLKTNQQ
jgi:O-succinylbenzoic acid--CoA ligase